MAIAQKQPTESAINLSIEYFEFKLHHVGNAHYQKNEKKALKWFNKHPDEHLSTYCNELIDYLLNPSIPLEKEKDQEKYEQEINH